MQSQKLVVRSTLWQRNRTLLVNTVTPKLSFCGGNCFHTSTFSYKNEASPSTNVRGQQNEGRVPRTIYRQLLSWCNRYQGVPFSIPPVTISTPQVDEAALKHLRGMRSLLETSHVKDEMGRGSDRKIVGRFRHPAHYALYNDEIVVTSNMITFPEIHNSDELRGVIRSIYWLNNKNTKASIDSEEDESGEIDNQNENKDDGQKERVSLAFEAIKSCNQLASSELASRMKKRQLTIEARQGRHLRKENEVTDNAESERSTTFGRSNLNVPVYHVGQVVKHKTDKWRGVIVGWSVNERNDKDSSQEKQLTSLTTKKYTLSEPKNDMDGENLRTTTDSAVNHESRVKYTVLLDVHDATLLHSSKFVSLEGEKSLEAVVDPCLQRIHSHLVKQYFSKFDTRGHFVPNDILSYSYPMDCFSISLQNIGGDIGNNSNVKGSENSIRSDLEKSCSTIVNGVRKMGQRLQLLTEKADILVTKNQTTADNDQMQLMPLATALSMALESLSTKESISKSKSQPLHSAVSSLEKCYHFHIKIGSLLWAHKTHKKHKPQIKFSLGQIVEHAKYGYRGVVVAWDPIPKVDVTGWDGLQHVKNVKEKPFYHIRPDVNDCIRAFGGSRNFRYVCQDNLEACKGGRVELEDCLDRSDWKWDLENSRFIPSEEMKFMYAEPLGSHEHHLRALVEDLRRAMSGCLLEIRSHDRSGVFSMADLFDLLKSAETLEDATVVQDFIKEIWKEHPDIDVRNKLDSGIANMLEGNNDIALEIFSSIILLDANYGEAWNKKATVHYMMGSTQESLSAAEEALRIDPKNFQALAGIGLVEMDQSRHEQAISAFQKSLEINPWSMVSARYSLCVNQAVKRKGTLSDED